MSKSLPLPNWLQITGDKITITLSQPCSFNGVKLNKLTLRAPLVRDMRTAQRQADDETGRELHLFATLAEVGVNDIEGMKWADYKRLQEGYFRLDTVGDAVTATVAPLADPAGEGAALPALGD